jgi:peptidoglycan hydrolase CwlO-like protein
MNSMLKKIVILLLVVVFVVFARHFVYSQTATPAPDNSQAIQDLQNKINDLQNKISDLQGQEKTLSSQISLMDNKIRLTEYQIEAKQEQITSLTLDIDTAIKKITNLQSALETSIGVLINRIVATYEVGTIQPIQILLTSNNAADFFTRLNYLKLAQAHDKKLIYDTQQAKVDYTNQKNILENEKAQVESLKKQLQAYSDLLDQQKQAKQDLLAETQGSEANYQQILAQTKAQLAGFQGFVTSQGGASLLDNQTDCGDSWGCYYNQRDRQWGGNSLNGTGYSLADSGCLVTSMAMVYTHYGHKDVNPQSINSNPGNFGGIPPALLKYSITANGVSASRASADIDSTLSSGNPVIIGISYDGGSLPDHFLVLISGSGGNYMMNDPFTPNGHNISFRGRYPSVRIVEVDKVNF